MRIRRTLSFAWKGTSKGSVHTVKKLAELKFDKLDENEEKKNHSASPSGEMDKSVYIEKFDALVDVFELMIRVADKKRMDRLHLKDGLLLNEFIGPPVC